MIRSSEWKYRENRIEDGRKMEGMVMRWGRHKYGKTAMLLMIVEIEMLDDL